MFCRTADGSIVENEGDKTLIMSTSDGAQLRKVAFQVANVDRAIVVVDTMVAPPGREQRSKLLRGEAMHVAGPVSPTETTD